MKKILFILFIFSAIRTNAASVISDSSFIADCSILSDESQKISAGESTTVEILDNKWLINVNEVAEAWAIFATIDFNGKTIDLSKNKFLKVKLSTNGLALEGVTKVIFRIYQKDSPGKYITFFAKAEGQSYTEIYDISQGWPDGVDNTFDFKSIEKIEIATEVNPGAGTITIEEFELGTYKLSTSIVQTFHTEVVAYPNPTKNQLSLLNINDNANIAIFNTQGQLVLKQTLYTDRKINMENFRPGMYFIMIENKQLLKIIKE